MNVEKLSVNSTIHVVDEDIHVYGRFLYKKYYQLVKLNKAQQIVKGGDLFQRKWETKLHVGSRGSQTLLLHYTYMYL